MNTFDSLLQPPEALVGFSLPGPINRQPIDKSLLKVALDKTLGDVPYNSAAQFLEYFDDCMVPSHLGMSCVRQSIWIDEFFQSIGGPAGSYIRSGRHVASIYLDSDGMKVLDPYLLHRDPLLLDFDRLSNGKIETSVPAFPVRSDAQGLLRWGKLRALWDLNKNSLQLDYTRFSPRRQQNYLYRSFLLDLAEVANFPSPVALARERLVHPEQNNLSIRVLDLHGESLNEVILPLRGVTEMTPAKREHFISRDNQGVVSKFGTSAFEVILGRVSASLKASPENVVQNLLRTSAVYSRVAPPDRDLVAYSLESE